MLRILLIDDNPNDRLMASRELRQAFDSLEIQTVIDASALKQALEAGGFDCVVTDYQLHWSDGLKVLKAVKARYSGCPVIMFTDSGSEEVAVAGMKAGLSDYVLKGRQIQRLSIAVRDSLHRQQLQQQYDHAIEQLSLSEERLRLGMAAAQLGSWDWDLASGKIVWSGNHEQLFGLESGNFDGTYDSFLACIHPEDREATRQAIAHALETQTEYRHEQRVVWADNSVHWIAGRGKFFYDADGRATRMIGVVLDITDRKQAEVEQARLLALEQIARTAAETANRLKDEFLATLSHELRSPLNAILGWAQLLRARQLTEAKTAQALETIERNARLQTQLIEDLLDVSRIMQGKLSLQISVLNLIEPIEAAIDTMRLAAEAKAIDLQFWASNADSEVREPFRTVGDSNRLQQVMWNLLSNAIKFTPTGGRVEVRLERKPHQAAVRQGDRLDATVRSSELDHTLHAAAVAQITVTDTGKGIPADFLPLVFDSFRQADASITRTYSGLGLGLAIVRHIVELHGGTIQAESPGEGQGATFTVRLPLLQRSQDLAQRQPEAAVSASALDVAPAVNSAPPQIPAPLAGIKVLLVEDELDSQEFLIFVLKAAGAIVQTAASTAEALKAIAAFNPNIVVSDIGMPDEDGYGLIRQIRHESSEPTRSLPAIALTAYATSEDRERALKAGFQQHLTKPVIPEVLIAAIASLTL